MTHEIQMSLESIMSAEMSHLVTHCNLTINYLALFFIINTLTIMYAYFMQNEREST